MNLRPVLFCLGLALLGCTPSGTGIDSETTGLRYYGTLSGSQTPQAVRVSSDRHLAYTHQFLPLDRVGNLVGAGDVYIQVEVLLDHIREALASAEADFSNLVRLNISVQSEEVAREVEKTLADRFDLRHRPAITWVSGALPGRGALVAMDAVATTTFGPGKDPIKNRPKESPYGDPKVSQMAILPSGPRLFISGQAEPGDSLREATRKTLEGLGKTLEWLALDKTRVVQVKSFLTPIEGAPEVQEEIAAFFGEVRPPVLSFVEWKSTLPIEIEMVVAGMPVSGTETPGEGVLYLTPPGMTASPVFCRATRVNHGDLIFTSGLMGPAGASAEEQVRGIFATLQEALAGLGSDLHHLVKATYFVSNEDTSAELNDLRPEYYNPARPPAASKAMVPGVGFLGRGIEVDMIAVGTDETLQSANRPNR